MSAPTFLALGHVTTDRVGGLEVYGGAALYSALQARALGCEVRVFTSAADGWGGRALLAGTDAHFVPSAQTTTFDYQSVHGLRRSALTATAAPLVASALPRDFAESDLVLLCPVFDELSADFPREAGLGARLLGVAPQGFLRRHGADGFVERAPWSAPASLCARADVLFFSEQDADDAEALAATWLDAGAGRVVITRGARGATSLAREGRVELPAVPVREVDPTGAGDVFATAFLVATSEGADVREAGAFAAAAATLAVLATGTTGIRERAAIIARKTA